MGKLVLGIIAVTLLQFAFFAYVGNDGADHSTVGETATRSDGKSSALSRLDETAPGVVPISPHPTAESVLVRTKVKAPSASGRSANIVKARADVRRGDRAVRNQARVPSNDYDTVRKFPSERIVVPKRSGAAIPRGYTMVLVDYTPIASGKHAKEISKHRKRSYLARALPALVKKPWNWIKSIASKLD